MSGVNVAYCRESNTLPAASLDCLIEESANGIMCVCVVRCEYIVTLYLDAHMQRRRLWQFWQHACMCMCEEARLCVCSCPAVMSKYINHAASSLTHVFIYLDDHLLMSVCRGAVNQMPLYSTLVMAEVVCVLARCSWYFIHVESITEADTASEEQLLQTLTHAQRDECAMV